MDSQAFAPDRNRIVRQLEACGLKPELVAELIGRHTPVRYPKGTPLFLQGSPADVVFAIQSGLVKTYCPLPDGSRILVDLCGPGAFVGYADLVDVTGQRSQIFEAQALTNCCAALITRHHLLKVLRDVEAPALLRVIEMLNSFWSTGFRRYAMFLGMSLRQRLEQVLIEIGARFGSPDARGTLLVPELSQEEMAEMIGSSRPMISKLLSEMTERGKILHEGRHYILLKKEQLASQRPQLRDLASNSVSGRSVQRLASNRAA